MKKFIVFLVAITIIAMSGIAMAADSTTLTVQASVLGTCKFSAGGATLDFGTLDPSVGNNVTGSTTLQFWCTKGVSTDVITAGNGSNWSGSSRQMRDAVSTDLIQYSLTLTKDANPNAGPGTPRTLTIDGGINGADYINKSAGSYTDSVALTINP